MNCYNAIAEEYRKQGDVESLQKAVHFHQLELSCCKQIDFVQGYSIALRFLGDCYRDLGDIANAKQCYHDALSLARQNCIHIADLVHEHACASTGIYFKGR